MAAKIEIIVGANTSQANAALKKTEQQLVSTGKAVQGLDKQMGGNLTKGANQATNALTNFGRIAQDAPFGIIGITNNINPLLESFQRLKVETGSTSAAFKALGAGLMGPAGIGIAVSLATSALTVLAMNGFFRSEKAADAAAEAAKKFKDTVKSIYEDTGQEATRVTALIAVLKNETETRERKLAAIKELNKISPETFNNLKLEGNAVEGLDASYKAYIESLKTVIAAKIKQAQLESAITKLLEAQGTTQTVKQKQILGALKNVGREQENYLKSLGVPDANNPFLQLSKGLEKKQANTIAEITSEVEILTKELTELSKGVDVKIDVDKDGKKKKDVETVISVLNDLQKKLRDITVTGFALSEKTISEKINVIQSAVKKLISDFNLDETNVTIRNLRVKIDSLQAVQELQEKITQEVARPGSTGSGLQITVPANVKLRVTTDELQKSVEKVETDIAPIMESLGNNIGNSLGESIGNALSGNEGFTNLFEGIFKVIASGLKELGKLLIQTGVKMAIAKAALDKIKMNPYLTIAAGVALVALGQAAQNSFNKKKAFARGGFVPGVGNTDSVDAALMPGEFVMRKSAVQAIGSTNLSLLNAGVMPAAAVSPGMQTIQIVGDGMISGENIYVAYKRYEQRRGRNT